MTDLNVRKGIQLEQKDNLFWCGEIQIPGVDSPVSYFIETEDRAFAFLSNLRNNPGPQPTIPTNKGPVVTMGFGTCFAITDDGYCLTNEHVTRGATDIKLRVGAREVPAQIISQNSELDLAVIKADWRTKPLYLRFGDNIALGAKVFTIGFPKPEVQGFTPKFTEGVISSRMGMKDNPLHYQHSAAIQPGNSGGALVDEDGFVVGIIKSILVGENVQNVNYAIKGPLAVKWLGILPALSGKLTAPGSAVLNYDTAKQVAESATAMVIVTKTGTAGPSASSGAVEFSLSKSGIRHNSRCRFYDPSKPCNSTDGNACKLCDG